MTVATGISIVIPTLDREKGLATGQLGLALAGCKRSTPVELVVSHDRKREGFTKTANKGMHAANPEYDICLLNDDILEFPIGWLELLRLALYSKPRYGLACPGGKSASAPMCNAKPGMRGTQTVKQASFWCVLLKREMINQIGYLDEDMIHYCSDNEYCHRMRPHWKCVWAKAVFLKHKHHGSGMQSKWRSHDRKVFFKKIGKK